jgi:hypothetical protein
MSKKATLLILAPVLLAGLTWFWWSREKTIERSDQAEIADRSQLEKASRPPINPEIRVIGGNPFTEDYGKEGGTMAGDLGSLMLVIQACQQIVKNFDEQFLPDNRAIVAFLQGDNRDRLAWIPPDHAFVNEDGELVDRWRNPVFFHRESGLKFSLRSSGPDGRMWTDDDLVKE